MHYSAQLADVHRSLLRTYPMDLVTEELNTETTFFSKCIVLLGEFDCSTVLSGASFKVS